MADPAIEGRWNVDGADIGFAGVHAALLPTGKVLFFSYDDRAENDSNRGLWRLWHPAHGMSSDRPLALSRNLFCSGHCFLADGRLLVAGGQSNNNPPFIGWGADHDVHTFDPISEKWTRHSDMPAARYYPTCVTLPDGNALIVGGAASRYFPTFQNISNDDYEIFYWNRDIKSQPIRFNPGHVQDMYPFLQVIPDGSSDGALFVYSGNQARLFSISTSTWNPNAFRTLLPHSRNYPHQGACVLLPLLPQGEKGIRVLVLGGQGEEGGEHRATDTAEIFDFNPDRPQDSHWRRPRGGNMSHRRFMSDGILLPDGNVLIVSGAAKGEADNSADAVLEVELFNSKTETWSAMAPVTHQRLYHAAALLLPDGRVMVSGHTRHWNPTHEVEDGTIEIFRPPYLFRGPRPVVAIAPQELSYGTQIEIHTEDAQAIKSVVLIRASSVTHTNNMDQRFVTLAIQQRRADRLLVTTPLNGSVAPPGIYMLFIVNNAEVPSIAVFSHLRQRVSPGMKLLLEKTVVVREADFDIDTGVDVAPGDDVAFEATGSIWAGVAWTGRNGPRGWNNIDHDQKFPLHAGPDAHPFSMLGRYGGGQYFFIGDGKERESYPYPEVRRLILRINDDKPGNGNGEFQCLLRVWRKTP